MNLTVNVLFRMVNHLMNVVSMKAAIAFPTICEQFRALLYIASHFGVQSQLSGIVNNLCSDLTVTLLESHDSNLANAARACNPRVSLVSVHIAGKTAADVGFVSLNLTAHLHLKRSGLHGKTDAMNHEPSGLLSNADSAMDFIRTDAVLTVRQHPDRRQPLIQAKRRIFKDRSNFDGELTARVRALALPLALLRQKANVSAPACRTDNTVRPASRHKVVKAVVSIREEDDCLLKCFRGRHAKEYARIKLIRQVYYCPCTRAIDSTRNGCMIASPKKCRRPNTVPFVRVNYKQR